MGTHQRTLKGKAWGKTGLFSRLSGWLRTWPDTGRADSVSARRRTDRDWRRRQLGQNFLDPATADQIVDPAAFAPSELVLEIGAGSGAITRALTRRALRVIAVEPDPAWARRLRDHGVRVIE